MHAWSKSSCRLCRNEFEAANTVLLSILWSTADRILHFQFQNESAADLLSLALSFCFPHSSLYTTSSTHLLISLGKIAPSSSKTALSMSSSSNNNKTVGAIRHMNDSTMPPPPPSTGPPKAGTRGRAPSRIAHNSRIKAGFGLSDWTRLLKSSNDLAQRKGQALRRDIRKEEVAEHDQVYDGWMILHNKVYNVAPYLEYHPGGAAIMKPCLGKDATALFEKYHRWVNVDG